MCSTQHNGSTYYMISCDYIRGCDKTGCSYTLAPMKNSSSTVQGTNSGIIEIQGISYNLTVTDMEGLVVQSEELNFSTIYSCKIPG